MNSNALKPLLYACLGSILLGASAIFVRLSDLGPMTTGFYRMLLALPLLALWMGWEKREGLLESFIPRKNGVLLILAGVFFALDLALWNWSIDHTTIVNATLFNNTAAFFVPLIMWVLFKEKQSIRYILAASTGFVGCLFLVGESFTISWVSLLGDVVALSSGLMVALYLVSLKKVREGISTGFLMFWTGAVSVFILGFAAYLFGESFGPLSVKDFFSVFGQAVLVHALGQSLLAYSLGKIPASYTALIMFLAPLTAAVLGWIFYGEALSLIKIIGMVLIMASIIAARRST